MWNWRNRKILAKRKKTNQETNLNSIEQTDGEEGMGRRDGGKQAMGIKECPDYAHPGVVQSAESLFCSRETNITLYVNKLEF